MTLAVIFQILIEALLAMLLLQVVIFTAVPALKSDSRLLDRLLHKFTPTERVALKCLIVALIVVASALLIRSFFAS